MRLRVIRFRLVELLRERGWSAYKLAKESGLPQPTVYRLLEPKAADAKISLATLDALCEALDVGVAELLEREGKRRRR